MFVTCYIKSGDYWKALPSIQKDVKTALDKNNVLIAVSRQAPIIRTEPAMPGNTMREEPATATNPPLEGGSKNPKDFSGRVLPCEQEREIAASSNSHLELDRTRCARYSVALHDFENSALRPQGRRHGAV